MKIIDISWPISEAITGYKDRKTVTFETKKTMEQYGVRESTIHLDSHTGTHVDAPSHFLPGGRTIDSVALASLVGAAQVIDCIGISEKITSDFLRTQSIRENDIILFKTMNSQKYATENFDPNFIYLDSTGADYLAEKKVKAVGIDYLGIERNQTGHTTHWALMHHDITIIEGLRLGHVQSGKYEFICLPLAVIGLEAAPARAILIERG